MLAGVALIAVRTGYAMMLGVEIVGLAVIYPEASSVSLGRSRSSASRVQKPKITSVGVLLVELYLIELFSEAAILGSTVGYLRASLSIVI